MTEIVEQSQYDIALLYKTTGLLKSDHVDAAFGKLDLFCYSADCFHAKNAWNDVTETHRGKLYCNEVPVNRPFKKIFNLNERPETTEDVVLSRMQNEEYEILDKANGHLFIVSAFKDESNQQNIVFHTKGSLYGSTKHYDNVLLDTDVAVFTEVVNSKNFKYLVETYGYLTLCFEAIVEHDPHTMYSVMKEEYKSGNTFVLLGASMYEDVDLHEWIEFDHNVLKELAHLLNLPVIKRYDEKNGKPSDWLNDTGVEGYVIRFLSDDSRVKVKTKEYWGLRFKNDLSAERIITMFGQSKYGKIEKKLPEEVCNQIANVLDSVFRDWYFMDYLNIKQIQDITYECIHKFISPDRRKQIAQSKALTTQQKTFLFRLIDDKDMDLSNSRQLRHDFTKDCLSNPELMNTLRESLGRIVDNM